MVNYNNLPCLVGRNLKRALQARGITQERFAEQIGVSDRTVRRWVCGNIHSLETVGEIANALQIQLGDILGEDVPFLFHRTEDVLLSLWSRRYNTALLALGIENNNTGGEHPSQKSGESIQLDV